MHVHRPIVHGIKFFLRQLHLDQLFVQQDKQINKVQLLHLGRMPVMFVECVQPSGLDGLQLQPWTGVFRRQALAKAMQLVNAERHARQSRVVALITSRELPYRLVLVVDALRPQKLVVDFLRVHLSGLRGLFVWKQKATTDAPDTHNA